METEGAVIAGAYTTPVPRLVPPVALLCGR
jgi:hypothetical protein